MDMRVWSIHLVIIFHLLPPLTWNVFELRSNLFCIERDRTVKLEERTRILQYVHAGISQITFELYFQFHLEIDESAKI